VDKIGLLGMAILSSFVMSGHGLGALDTLARLFHTINDDRALRASSSCPLEYTRKR
jgi:hypothetical protein